ncbi:hypothetical protein C8J57DRAFT_692390 [Mycena rebaudengoi]|nr:hypothetical protein C8J57DRAFT_692390 [Mycena rebaudengoi]
MHLNSSHHIISSSIKLATLAFFLHMANPHHSMLERCLHAPSSWPSSACRLLWLCSLLHMSWWTALKAALAVPGFFSVLLQQVLTSLRFVFPHCSF